MNGVYRMPLKSNISCLEGLNWKFSVKLLLVGPIGHLKMISRTGILSGILKIGSSF